MKLDAVPAKPQRLNRLLITADAVGGVWQYTVDLVHQLTNAGTEVLVATMGPPPSEQQRNQLPSAVTLVSGAYRLEWQPDAWIEVDEAADWLLDLCGRFDPEIVHLNGYAHAALPWGRPVLVVAHSCVISWFRAVSGQAPGPDWDEYKRRVQRGLQASTRIVAPSEFMAREIELCYGISTSKVEVIPNCSRSRPVRTEPKEDYCLAAGRAWDRAKNFSILEAAAPEVNWPILLAGDSDQHSVSGIQMLGNLRHSTLLETMAQASIFVHPALYEPFGLTILEAARARCCLVLADTASARELWSGAAIFVDPHTPAKWAAEINRLTASPAEREHLGRLAQRHSASYSAIRFENAYLNLYRGLLAGKARVEAAA